MTSYLAANAIILPISGCRAGNGLAVLENLPEHQASALAYFDAFLIFTVVGVVLAFLVLLMKRSAVEKGAHIAAE